MAIFEPNIYMREIKELYSEELALLKQIRSYGREHSQGKMERVEKVKLLLLFRIYSNLYSSLLLTVQVLKTGKISFFQLPIGLLLRCCFTDCLFALYIQRAGKERAYEELDLRTIEYANSMLERKEVYRDQVKSTGKILDDVFIDHLWELTMEDNFLGLLTLDDNLEELTVIKQSKGQLKDAGFTKQIVLRQRILLTSWLLYLNSNLWLCDYITTSNISRSMSISQKMGKGMYLHQWRRMVMITSICLQPLGHWVLGWKR